MDARSGYVPPANIIESSFKHYPEMAAETGPELINMTSSVTAGGNSSTLGHGDVVDVTLQRSAAAIATLNNGGAVATLPRSSLASRGALSGHATLKRSVDELRQLDHNHEPS